MSYVQHIEYANSDDIDVPYQKLRYLQLSPILILRLVFDKNQFIFFSYILDKCKNVIDASSANLHDLVKLIQECDFTDEQKHKYTTKLVDSDFFKRALVENFKCSQVEAVLDPNCPPGVIDLKRSLNDKGIVFISKEQELIDKITMVVSKLKGPQDRNSLLKSLFREINNQSLHDKIKLNELDIEVRQFLTFQSLQIFFD